MNQNNKLEGEIIAIDLGKSRTGVARMNTLARIPEPLVAITMDDDYVQDVKSILREHKAVALVVGLPRSLEGNETMQTAWVREQYAALCDGVDMPVYLVDEAATTKLAEERAKPNQSIDSVAAAILLEDFANEVLRGNIDNASF